MSGSNSGGKPSSSSSLVGSEIEVSIEKMAVGGAGLARYNGLVVFVDYAAPGDTLRVKILEHKKNLAFGKILEILHPGPERIQPRCEHFGSCGGCAWQHLSQSEQLRQKESILRDSLKEILKDRSVEIRPIKPSPLSFEYRNRVQMNFQNGSLSFRAKRSQDLIPIRSCVLVEKPLQNLIQAPTDKKLVQGLRYDLRLSPEDGTTQITALGEDVELVGFSQVNRFQNEDLIQAVLSAIRSNPDVHMYEFYAGSGNFTFPIITEHKFAHVWAVEASPALVELAHGHILRSNLSNKKVSFHLGDVAQFLRSQWPRPQDVVFLDPPRIGADEFVIKTLALARPAQILYLSCHPVTLARDLRRLLGFSPDYEIDFIQPFEMFPQTDHIETLVSLSLTKS